MVDYRFLGLVAVVVALVTRGAVLPVLAVTAVIALASLACEAATRRRDARLDGPRTAEASSPSDTELTRWSAVVDRLLHSHD